MNELNKEEIVVSSLTLLPLKVFHGRLCCLHWTCSHIDRTLIVKDDATSHECAIVRLHSLKATKRSEREIRDGRRLLNNED